MSKRLHDYRCVCLRVCLRFAASPLFICLFEWFLNVAFIFLNYLDFLTSNVGIGIHSFRHSFFLILSAARPLSGWLAGWRTALLLTYSSALARSFAHFFPLTFPGLRLMGCCFLCLNRKCILSIDIGCCRCRWSDFVYSMLNSFLLLY